MPISKYALGVPLDILSWQISIATISSVNVAPFMVYKLELIKA